MSFFKNIFQSSEDNSTISKIEWKALTHLDQLNEITIESKDKAVLIFKHSTRCSVSRMVLKQFENEFDIQDKITPYFLDLLEHRDISNEIADRFNVIHQSPQVVLIKNKTSVYNASHESINIKDLMKFV